MKLNHMMLTTAIAVMVFTGCKKDDDEQLPKGAIEVSAQGDAFGEDDGSIVVTFNTGTALETDIVITYEVSGSATAGEDFEVLPGTITIPAGQTSVTETLTLLDDEEREPSEELIIDLRAFSGAPNLVKGPQSVITITITDNDSLPFENGILVLHEGNYGGANASISFVSEDFNQVENGIFKSVNEVDAWGDIAQSMAFDGNLAYIVVNNSQKIEVVERYTFKSVATIGGPDEDDFLNPRYMVIVNGKGYVTNWGDGADPNDDYVAVVNLENNTLETKIPVPEGPERLLVKENTIYVAMQGGFNQNNIVTVIDAITNTVATTITVADRPNSLQLDEEGNLWVLSGGNPSWVPQFFPDLEETAGQLDKIDTSSNTVIDTFAFEQTEHPGKLSINEDNLYYYLAGSIYKFDTSSAQELPSISEITTSIGFYRMGVINGKLYGVNEMFTGNGTLEFYDLSDNSLLLSQEVSIGPSEVYANDEFEF